jgi:lysozyme family protein
MTNLVALRAANAARWANAKLTRGPEFTPVAKRLIAGRARFQAMEAQTGVPWFVIAVIKERESGADPKWLKSIAQGQPWNKKSTIVPVGRGPFNSWEDAAYDALVNCAPKAAKNKDWSIGGTLTLLEQYNGLGYANKKLPSPYIWSGTDQYKAGKYIRDGVFSATTVDAQLGCAGLLLAMQALDKSITFGEAPARRVAAAPTTIESVQTAPVPVSAERPGIWATLWRVVRGKDASVATTPEIARPGLALNGDTGLYDQQAMLSDKGWTEVGQPDGLMGTRTRDAISAFRKASGLPAGDTIDARFTAALAAAGPRQVAKARVEANASDLRANGNSQVAALDSFGWVGKLLLGGGLLGGADQTGILSKANDTLQSAQDTLGTVTTVFTTIIGIAQWCFAHWWMFALGGGIYIVFRVAMAVLNMVVMFRQGFLARADR